MELRFNAIVCNLNKQLREDVCDVMSTSRISISIARGLLGQIGPDGDLYQLSVPTLT
jgi:hypothetical protein